MGKLGDRQQARGKTNRWNTRQLLLTMPYERPSLRTKRLEYGTSYGRRFGARDLAKNEQSLHETVAVYRIKVPLGQRYRDQYSGRIVSDYCPQDGSVDIKWTEWTWTKTGDGPGGNNSGDGGYGSRGRSGGGSGSGSGGSGTSGGTGLGGSSSSSSGFVDGIGSGSAGSPSPSQPTGASDGSPMSWDAVNNDQNSPTSATQQTPPTTPKPPTSQHPPELHDAYITGERPWQPIHSAGGGGAGGSNSSNYWWGNYGSNNSGTTWTYQGGSNWSQGGWYQDAGNWSWSSYETFK
jgi:hypothetical protein